MMSSEIFRSVIADSTCLIVLSKIGALELLRETYGEILVTSEVQHEWGELPPHWMRVERPADQTVLRIPASLGAGETSSILLAASLGAPA